MKRFRYPSLSVALIVGFLCAPMASVVEASADGDVQLIRLNEWSFFIPKSWMRRRGAVIADRSTPGGSSKGTWSEPQAELIDATDLIFLAPDQNISVVKDWTDPLPSLIYLASHHDRSGEFAPTPARNEKVA
jgi:hypothetical protein